MNKSLTITLIAGMTLAIAGCDRKESSPAPATTPSHTTPSNPPAPAPVEQPKPVEAPKTVASTQATPEGTMTLFIAAMAKGDIPGATTYVDPGSLGYKEFNGLSETLKNFKNEAPSNDSKERADADTFIRAAFASNYKKATFTKEAEQSPRAKVVLTFTNGKTVNVDLSLIQDKWFIIAPEKGLMEPDASAIPGGAASSVTPPPPVAPRAPEPAPAEPAPTPAPEQPGDHSDHDHPHN